MRAMTRTQPDPRHTDFQPECAPATPQTGRQMNRKRGSQNTERQARFRLLKTGPELHWKNGLLRTDCCAFCNLSRKRPRIEDGRAHLQTRAQFLRKEQCN